MLLLHACSDSWESLSKETLILKEESTAHVSNGILLQRNVESISTSEHLVDYLFDAHLWVLIFVDKVGVFGESAGVDPNWNFVFIANFPNLSQIFERDRLASRSVISHSHENQRNVVLSFFLNEVFQNLWIQISFEIIMFFPILGVFRKLLRKEIHWV